MFHNLFSTPNLTYLIVTCPPLKKSSRFYIPVLTRILKAGEEFGAGQHGQPAVVLQHQGEEALAAQAPHQRHLHRAARHTRSKRALHP